MASSNTKLAVFNLPTDVRDSELKDLFRSYGKLRDYHIRENRGSTMAFVEFDEPRDAEDALDARNDYSFAGRRLRVEFARPQGPSGLGGPPGAGAGGGGGGVGGGANRDAPYRVKVTGLPRSASWQDLKDFMRAGGDVKHTDVEGGVGIAGFNSRSEMDRAVRELDDTKFRARNGDSAYVRVREDGKSSKSRSRRRSRSRSRRGRSRSRSHGIMGRSCSRSDR